MEKKFLIIAKPMEETRRSARASAGARIGEVRRAEWWQQRSDIPATEVVYTAVADSPQKGAKWSGKWEQ